MGKKAKQYGAVLHGRGGPLDEIVGTLDEVREYVAAEWIDRLDAGDKIEVHEEEE